MPLTYLYAISKGDTDEHEFADILDNIWIGEHTILEALV